MTGNAVHCYFTERDDLLVAVPRRLFERTGEGPVPLPNGPGAGAG